MDCAYCDEGMNEEYMEAVRIEMNSKAINEEELRELFERNPNKLTALEKEVLEYYNQRTLEERLRNQWDYE